jgi:translation elongation factor EF-G
MEASSAFRDLVPPILMEAFAQSEMLLLEPFLVFELRVTAEAVSKALYELSIIDAKVDDTKPFGEMICITGMIPADTCKSYGIKVSSYIYYKNLARVKYIKMMYLLHSTFIYLIPQCFPSP